MRTTQSPLSQRRGAGRCAQTPATQRSTVQKTPSSAQGVPSRGRCTQPRSAPAHESKVQGLPSSQSAGRLGSQAAGAGTVVVVTTIVVVVTGTGTVVVVVSSGGAVVSVVVVSVVVVSVVGVSVVVVLSTGRPA